MAREHSADTSQFLARQLQEVTCLLEKQQLEKELVRRSASANQGLVQTMLLRQQQTRLQEKFAALHPADVAFILESLPPELRKAAWDSILSEREGQVLLALSDAVRQTLIAGMADDELACVASNLEVEELAELAHDLPRRTMLQVLRSLNSTERQHVDTLLAYQPHQIGAIMDFGMIAIRDDLTLKAVSSYLRSLGKLPGHTDKLFVVDFRNQVRGVLPLQRLLTHAPSLTASQAMVTEFIQFQADHDSAEAARAFERYTLISAPVVDADGSLLGRVCVDSILDYIRAKSDEELLSQAGVAEEEDLFASLWSCARNRWGWLLVNIATAFASTRIISWFEDVIVQVVALASLMPIVAAMGGNSGNQTSMLIIRSLALGQINPANTLRLVRKELGLAALNGALVGLLMGLLGLALHRDAAIAAVMAAAMFINLVVAAVVGLSIPLLRHRLGKDPAMGTSVLLTSVTDAMGFFIVLGLASWLLLG